MSSARIYLDHNGSTPVAPEVRAAMAPFLGDHFGNPSSGHWASVESAAALTTARHQVAGLLGARASEITFTSGGTESNNWALVGAIAHARRVRDARSPHVVISAVEHPSISAPCRYLEQFGVRITLVAVDRHGLVDPDDVKRAIENETVIVSVMHANNEVGTIQPIRDIAHVAHDAGVLCHSDAAQSLGKVPVDVDDLGVDLLTVAGHKLYAPKGVGALYVREGTCIDPLVHGAGHEGGRRAGTENVAFSVALGAAAALAHTSPCEAHLRSLTTAFHARLVDTFGSDVALLGHPTQRLPNTLNIGFVGRVGADLLAKMPLVAASTGSACDAGVRSLSSVQRAMGVSEHVGLGAIRFSVGRGTTATELEHVVQLLRAIS